MQAHRMIYEAKDQILRNKRIMIRAEQLRDYATVGKLRKENEDIRRLILDKYAVIIDY